MEEKDLIKEETTSNIEVIEEIKTEEMTVEESEKMELSAETLEELSNGKGEDGEENE